MSTAPDRHDDPRIGRSEARMALDESRASRANAASLIAEARDALNIVKAHTDDNHYVEKFRAILRGN